MIELYETFHLSEGHWRMLLVLVEVLYYSQMIPGVVYSAFLR